MHCGSSSDPGADGSAGSGAAGSAGSGVNPAGGALASGGNTSAGSAGAATAGNNASSGSSNAGNSATGGTAAGGSSASGAAGMGMVGMSGAGSGGTAGKGGTGGVAGTASSAGGGTAGGSSACNQGATHSGGTQYCSNATGTLSNGYSYQRWSSGSGTGCMTPYGADANFKANWSNVADFLARVGLGWNSSQTYDQLGTIAADYAYTKTGSGGGFSFIGIYGWSESPLVEYYIVEDWYGTSIPTGNGTLQGSFSVDGGTYNVYTHMQTNQPAITGGNATFPQFFSVRQTPRQCGHISITEHFKKWASLGMNLGKMEEARILVEVGGGTGSIDFTTAALTATK